MSIQFLGVLPVGVVVLDERVFQKSKFAFTACWYSASFFGFF
jgi:hypothetical protein